MKAILRGGAGLLACLLAASVSPAYVFVSPVFKQPYPQAPSPCNTGGVYFIDAWGRVVGPYYFLQPPCQPFNGLLPGPTGQAIMAGNLPHTLLLSKEGLAIGNVPLVGQKRDGGSHEQGSHPGAGLPEMGGPPGPYAFAGGSNNLGPGTPPQPNMQIPYGPMPPYGPRPPAGPMPYPMAAPNVQVPYPPYGGMPYRAMPASMPYPPMQYMPAPMATPMPRMPVPTTYYPMSNPSGVSQAQNLAPGGQPFMPIPGFGVPGAPLPPGGPAAPGAPGAPFAPLPPMMSQPGVMMPPGVPGMPMPPTAPTPPGMDTGGSNGFQFFGPMQNFQPSERLYPLQPLQVMQPPAPQMEPMQLPRMDYAPPPVQKVGGNVYPTHPFVRSPRDFFMWGETMDDEIKMRRRPVPVP